MTEASLEVIAISWVRVMRTTSGPGHEREKERMDPENE